MVSGRIRRFQERPLCAARGLASLTCAEQSGKGPFAASWPTPARPPALVDADLLNHVANSDRFDDRHATDYLAKDGVAAVEVRRLVQRDIELAAAGCTPWIDLV